MKNTNGNQVKTLNNDAKTPWAFEKTVNVSGKPDRAGPKKSDLGKYPPKGK